MPPTVIDELVGLIALCLAWGVLQEVIELELLRGGFDTDEVEELMREPLALL